MEEKENSQRWCHWYVDVKLWIREVFKSKNIKFSRSDVRTDMLKS